MTEKELQNQLFELVKTNSFLQAITGAEKLDDDLKISKSENIIPFFSVDSLLRERYSERAKVVLESLNYYELISEEDKIQNISLKKGEQLFPDLILFNYETLQIIVIENKVSKQTEREAITELLGYAHEIRNHLPFFSSYEICYIIIASDFSTLLDHSVAGEILSTSNSILCLKPTFHNEKISFQIHFPRSWTDVGQDNLPKHALTSYTLCLTTKEKFRSDDAFDPIPIIRLAVDSISREGNKHNSSGFYLAFINGTKELSDFDFGITIYSLNAFKFFEHAIDQGFQMNDNSILAKYLINKKDSFISPNPLFRVADKAKPILEPYFEIEWDRSSNWETDWEDVGLRLQRLPVLFDSWGAIGEFVRYFYFHPAVRNHYLDAVETNDFGFLRPPIGLQIINLIAGTGLFAHGKFTPTDIFKFAIQLQICKLAHIGALELSEETRTPTEANLFWSNITLLQSLKEIRIRVRSTGDIVDWFPLGLYFNKNEVTEDSSTKFDEFANWFADSFLKNNPAHREIFRLGFYFGPFTIPEYRDDSPNEKIAASALSQFSRAILGKTAEALFKKEIDLSKVNIDRLAGVFKIQPSGSSSEGTNHLSDQFLIEQFPSLLHILNETIGEVSHKIAPFNLNEITNLEWFKERAHERFNEGLRYCVFEISSDGGYGIGQLNKEERMLGPLIHKDEIFVKYNDSGIATIRRTTWNEMKNESFDLDPS